MVLSSEEEDADFDRCMETASGITSCFVASCIRVAQALHANGVVERRFAGPIPIIVHERQYYEESALQNRLANPPGWQRNSNTGLRASDTV
jgi:hypothetical protein